MSWILLWLACAGGDEPQPDPTEAEEELTWGWTATGTPPQEEPLSIPEVDALLGEALQHVDDNGRVTVHDQPRKRKNNGGPCFTQLWYSTWLLGRSRGLGGLALRRARGRGVRSGT